MSVCHAVQAVVFCNRKPTAEWLSRRLTAAGCPSAHLSSDLPQTEVSLGVQVSFAHNDGRGRAVELSPCRIHSKAGISYRLHQRVLGPCLQMQGGGAFRQCLQLHTGLRAVQEA